MEEPQAGVVDTETPCGTGYSVADGHLNSLFFTMLPPELRLKIYEEAFDGSTAEITWFPWHRAPTSEQTWMAPLRKWMLRPSHHHQLLLTCHAVYEEAMPIYWSRTVVDMGGTDLNPGAGPMLAAFPSHARQYVQHITNVANPRGLDTWGYSGWTFAQLLSYLPTLKTCRLTDEDTVDCDEVQWSNGGQIYDSDDLTPEQKDQRIISSSLGHIGFMDGQVELFEEPFYSAVVLQKHQTRYRRPRDGKDIHQECFINHTAEYVYHRRVDGDVADSNDDLSDEYGFHWAIRDAPPVPLRPRVMQEHKVDTHKAFECMNMLIDRV